MTDAFSGGLLVLAKNFHGCEVSRNCHQILRGQGTRHAQVDWQSHPVPDNSDKEASLDALALDIRFLMESRGFHRTCQSHKDVNMFFDVATTASML